MSKPLKVKISMTVEVDPECWDLLYGTGTDAASVREDVKSYFINHVQECPAAQDGGVTLV